MQTKALARWPLQLVVCLAIVVLLFLNLSRAPIFVQKLFPEGPSTCKNAIQFNCGECIPKPIPKDTLTAHEPPLDWSFDAARDGRNYGLSSAQCDVAFPGLFTDIHESARRRQGNHITSSELQRVTWPKASIQAMVYEGELYILGYTRPTVRGTRHQATLHALHRALVAAPTPVPDAEFALSVDDFTDSPDDLIWSYTRKAQDNNTWVMPDFGFWSWTGSQGVMGTWAQLRRRIDEVEEEIGSFANKIPKLFWRGNVAMAKRLRGDLLRVTKDKPWADVQGVDWDHDAGSSGDLMPFEDHCKYMFVVHTEGNSYSGRLKYLQNCRSVIFAHTLQWIQPFEYLMVSEGPKQNYVAVDRNFSDLEQKMEYYLNHRAEAERIADNSVAIFRDRYLTPAAEACYWRKLLTAWSSVSFQPEFYKGAKQDRVWRGTPFENYALRSRKDILFNGDVQ